MRFQRGAQIVTLTLFLGLLGIAATPYYDRVGVDAFVRLDPILALSTVTASRTWLSALLPGFVILTACLIAGRFFCGHICPMGTTLDAAQAPLLKGNKRTAHENAYEASSRGRWWKTAFAVVILAAAIGGVSLVHWGSPLSLVTRFYGLTLYPLVALLGESALDAGAPLFERVGLLELTYAQIPLRVYATNIFVFALFAGIVAAAYAAPRFWCRNLCAAGGLMGIFSRKPLVRRHVSEACTECGRCVRECPTAAIGENPRFTAHSECVVCLKCVDVCPVNAVSFGMSGPDVGSVEEPALGGRRAFLAAAGFGLVGAGLLRSAVPQPRPRGADKGLVGAELIRPPAALPEPDFLAACVRCGECMHVCPTNTLQPIVFEAGLEGLFSPVIRPRIGGCDINCNACGRVCPTSAIRDQPLFEKQHAKVGTAYVIRRNCLVWEQDKKCLVCDEACPYNAISFRPVPGKKNAAPFVIENRCIGCGWCENKCPVQGEAAIRVNVIGQLRLAEGSYQQRARELGFVFKAKDNKGDRLAPGTFEGPSVSKSAEPALRKKDRSSEEELPPGFIVE